MRVRAAPLNLQLHRPFTIARGSRTEASNVLVEVVHDDVRGLGEAAPNGRYGESQESALLAFQQFELPPGVTPLDMVPMLDAFSRSFPQESSARCALESALWDWVGKRAGKPLHELLNVQPRPTPVTSFTISIDDPDALAQRVQEAEAWPVLKVKLGGGDADVVAVERLRSVTQRPFRVDANEAWSEEEAEEKIPWLASQGCDLVEQPLPAGQWPAMARLKASSPLPLVADEEVTDRIDVTALAAAYHGINVKLMKTGGIRDAVRMIHAARGAGLDVMVGCMVESSLGITAAAHLSPLARWADLDGAALLAADPFEGARIEAGEIEIPEGPGLGVQARDA